jgi:ABC-type uncharacterized transport system substrate-binding protein
MKKLNYQLSINNRSRFLKITKEIKMTVLKTILLYSLLVCVSTAPGSAQSKVTYGQQIFVMLKVLPSLKNIGVIYSTGSDQLVQALTRAAVSQGVKVFIAKALTAREIPTLYKKLVEEKGVTMIWIPEEDDKLMVDIGFEFLRESTIADKVGLYVPTQKLVSEGALCSVQIDGGKLSVYINQRVAKAIGANGTGIDGPNIQYVVK